MVGSSLTGRSLLVFNVRTNFLILNEEGTARLVCTPRILVGASLEVGVTSLMKRILEACSWRLAICGGGYATSDKERFLQALTLLLMTMGMTAIGLGQGLLPVSLFRMMRITIISVGIRVHLAKV